MEQKLIRKRQDNLRRRKGVCRILWQWGDDSWRDRRFPYLHFGSFDRQEWLQLSFRQDFGGRQRRISFLVESGLGRGEDGKMFVRIIAVTARVSERIIKSLCCRIKVHETTVKEPWIRIFVPGEYREKLKGGGRNAYRHSGTAVCNLPMRIVCRYFSVIPKKIMHPRIPAGKERLQGSVRWQYKNAGDGLYTFRYRGADRTINLSRAVMK